jgi:hypothetical protein
MNKFDRTIGAIAKGLAILLFVIFSITSLTLLIAFIRFQGVMAISMHIFETLFIELVLGFWLYRKSAKLLATGINK